MKPNATAPAALLSGLMVSPAAFAAEPIGAAASLLKVLVVLAVIIAMIFAAGWFFRRYGLPGQNKVAGLLHTLDTLHLGPRERLILVGIGDQRVLIGVSAGQMTRLARLHAEDIHTDTGSPHDVSFSDTLKDVGETDTASQDRATPQ